MENFSFAGWIPILADEIVCFDSKIHVGWFFLRVSDKGPEQYIAYKMEFNNDSGLICKLTIHANESNINFHKKIVNDYGKQKNIVFAQRNQWYDVYSSSNNVLNEISKLDCEVECYPKSGLVISRCLYDKRYSNAFESVSDWRRAIFTILRDFYHVHTHHGKDCDACLNPYGIEEPFDEQKFYDYVWKQYQKKIVLFQQDIALRIQQHATWDTERLKTKNIEEKLHFFENSLSYIQNYRGELIYAKSFLLRFCHSNSLTEKMEESLNRISESFSIKFDYLSVKYETLIDHDSHSLAQNANIFAILAVLIAIGLGVLQIIIALCKS